VVTPANCLHPLGDIFTIILLLDLSPISCIATGGSPIFQLHHPNIHGAFIPFEYPEIGRAFFGHPTVKSLLTIKANKIFNTVIRARVAENYVSSAAQLVAGMVYMLYASG
jgi:hypothetical protein